MRVHTDVTFGKKGWEIIHKYDETMVEELCKYERLEGENGFAKDHSHRTIAKIPRHRFFSDIELMLYQKYQGLDDVEANKQLNKWLLKNPKFRTCTGGI